MREDETFPLFPRKFSPMRPRIRGTRASEPSSGFHCDLKSILATSIEARTEINRETGMTIVISLSTSLDEPRKRDSRSIIAII